MTPRLTKEQCEAARQHAGRPIQVVDPVTDAVFYLISEQQFNQIRSLLESSAFDISETYPAQEQALGAVWSDEALDVYNDSADGSIGP